MRALMHLAQWLLVASLLASACGGDDEAQPMTGGTGGVASGGNGATGGDSGAGAGSGDSGAGGMNGVAGMNAVAGMGGTGGTGATGGMSAASGGDDGGDPDDAGMNNDSGMAGSGGMGGGDGPPYTNDCTLEEPWDCKVCDDQETCDAPTYTVNGDGTVTSSCCGLTWQQQTEWVINPEDEFEDCNDREEAAGCYDFDGAAAYCNALTLAGGGFRVPAPVEIATLQLYGVATPRIDTTAFPDPAVRDLYWTSASTAVGINRAWVAGFAGTYRDHAEKGTQNFVRCVRTAP